MTECVGSTFLTVFIKFAVKVFALARNAEAVCPAVLAVTEYFQVLSCLCTDFFQVGTGRSRNILHLVLRDQRDDIEDRCTKF